MARAPVLYSALVTPCGCCYDLGCVYAISSSRTPKILSVHPLFRGRDRRRRIEGTIDAPKEDGHGR